MQATIPAKKRENVIGEVVTYTLSPEELEKYNTKPNQVEAKQRNLTRWSKEKPIEILEDLKRSWYPDEISRFIKMWNAGECITKVASELKKDVDEVALLVIDQKRKGAIEIRSSGAYGRGLE
jgi:16S rRNA C967 or C1407 C5-methylase (RsmB/RsmF family)